MSSGPFAQRARLAGLATVLAVSCAACERQQAVPLTRSLPVATFLALMPIPAAIFGWQIPEVVAQRLSRRYRGRLERPPMTPPRLAAVVLVSLWALPCLALIVGIVREVAVGYRHAQRALFSWGSLVFLGLIVEIVALLGVVLVFTIARLLMAARPAGRLAAVILGVLGAGGSAYGLTEKGKLPAKVLVIVLGLILAGLAWTLPERRPSRRAKTELSPF